MWINKDDFNSLEERVSSLEERVSSLEERLFVDDYFEECPSNNQRKLLRSEAVSFRKIDIGYFYPARTYYTSRSNYENHKTLINKWAKEIKTPTT